jgi:hypothetical protein
MPESLNPLGLRRLFFDMHLPDWTVPGQSGNALHELRGVATRFDPEQLVELFARARVTSVVFFAKCQYGNFYCNTALGHKHSGLGELDLLGRVVELAHPRGIKVVAYYSNAWDVNAAREHPDWMMRDAQDHISYQRWPRVCLNSPYRDLVHAHLREMFTNYALDGVWMDMLHVLPCYCPRCQALFEKRFGQPMPRVARDSLWLDMVHFQYDYLYEYIAQARAVVKERRSQATFMFNYFGSPYAPPSIGLDATRQLTLSDCGSTEGYSEWHGLSFPSYAARLMRAAMRDRSYEVLTSRFVRTWDFTLRPTEQIKFEAFSVVANGGAVCLDDSPYHDGRPEPRVYDALGQAYAEIEAREPYLLEAEPVTYAGVYHSLKSREVGEMMAQVGHDGVGSSFYGFYPERLQAVADVVLSTQGAFKALVEGHLPVEFLYDQGVTADELRCFRALLLPNVVAMDAAEAQLLRDYVSAGGGLVATGATSLYDARGEPHPNFLLADLFGVDFVRRSPYSFTYLQLRRGLFAEGDDGMPLAHYRPLLEVRPNRQVEVAATLLEPLIETGDEVYYHNNQPPPYRDTGLPAIVVAQYGRGRVIYISGEPEANYCVLGHTPYRQLLLRALEWAAGAPPEIIPHVPLNTEVTYRRLGDKQILHFLTCWPQKRATFKTRSTAESVEESFPIFDVRVDVPPATRSALFLPGEQRLQVRREAGQTWVVLPKIRLWETLVLDE